MRPINLEHAAMFQITFEDEAKLQLVSQFSGAGASVCGRPTSPGFWRAAPMAFSLLRSNKARSAPTYSGRPASGSRVWCQRSRSHLQRRDIAEPGKGQKPETPSDAPGQAFVPMTTEKDAFDQWWEWANSKQGPRRGLPDDPRRDPLPGHDAYTRRT
jgi:hypothetical protein